MPITLRFVVRSTLALLGIGFTALLLIVITSVWLSERAQNHLLEVATARTLHNAATLVREGLLTAETSQRGFILTGNEIYLAPYDNAKTLVSTELQRLTSGLASQPDRQSLIGQLSNVVAEKIAEQDRTIALRGAGREAEAIAAVKSNRGKALMDEANVYLSAITLENDERLSGGVTEQTANTRWLRWTSIASAVVIILVVTGVLVTLQRYALEITRARDEVNRTNETLELRVEQRTRELARARDRAEVLLSEVNHRVSNSLALVSSLVRLQSRELTEPSAKSALEETDARIQAIAQMHKHLFTTDSVAEVAADLYLAAVLSQIESAMASKGSTVTLKRNLAPVTLATGDAVNLGIVVTEWVTNAFKYAYDDGCGEVRVHLEERGGAINVTVEDDGVGRGEVPRVKGTGFGTRVVNTIAGIMRAETSYSPRNPGTEARLSLPVRNPTAEAHG